MFIKSFSSTLQIFILCFYFVPDIISAATVTFNLGGDGSSWQDPANWDTGLVPTSADDVIIDYGATVTGTAPSSVHDLTVNAGSTLNINLTVTGVATFVGATNNSTITGNAVFTNGSYNVDYGVVTGNAVFNTNAGNFGGTVLGNATFNNISYNDAGLVQGNATFNNTSFNWGRVGSATFNNSSSNANGGRVLGDAVFNDTTTNDAYSTVEGNACFAATATNDGAVNGTTTVCPDLSQSGGFSTIQTFYGDGSIETTRAGITVFTPSSRVPIISIPIASSTGSTTATTGVVTTAVSSSSDLLISNPSTPIQNDKTLVSSSTSTFLFTQSLSFSMTDSQVVQLQVFLNTQGYTVSTTGAGSPGKETTYFGTATRAALIKFQKANNITPAAGYFGPITRGVVNAKR